MRIFFGAVLFISTISGIWWLSFALAVGGMIFFTSYYEAIIFALFADSLFAAPTSQVFAAPYATTLLMVLTFGLIAFLRGRLLLRS